MGPTADTPAMVDTTVAPMAANAVAILNVVDLERGEVVFGGWRWGMREMGWDEIMFDLAHKVSDLDVVCGMI